MHVLPDCDDLFLRFFDRWYNEATRQRRRHKTTFPDLLILGELVGSTQSEASLVVDEAQADIAAQIQDMVAASREDWPTHLPVSGEIDLTWVDAFDEYYDRSRIQDVIDRSDPAEFSNNYVVLCCEFGAVLSHHVLQSEHPRLIWQFDWPYWDSSLLDPRTGALISVFHWGIKKMSEYGVDDGFAAKIKACLQHLNSLP